MTTDTAMPELVREAKSAVEDLEEPYRMEAFKIILDRLISEPTKNIKNKNITPRKKPIRKTTNNRKASKQQTEKTTSLNLSIDEIKNLQSFYQAYSPDGGEKCAFILAMFLHNELKKEEFIDVDIEYLYRTLISVKVKVPNVSDWKRALGWLCTKSRKKEWLRKKDSIYSITNAGLIFFNDLGQKD